MGKIFLILLDCFLCTEKLPNDTINWWREILGKWCELIKPLEILRIKGNFETRWKLYRYILLWCYECTYNISCLSDYTING